MTISNTIQFEPISRLAGLPLIRLWRSDDANDLNVYCEFSDIQKHARGQLHGLPFEKVPFPISVAERPGAGAKYVCDANALEWLYQNTGSDVVVTSLEEAGVEFGVSDDGLLIHGWPALPNNGILSVGVSLFVELPENLYLQLQAFIDASDASQDEVIAKAVRELLKRSGE